MCDRYTSVRSQSPIIKTALRHNLNYQTNLALSPCSKSLNRFLAASNATKTLFTPNEGVQPAFQVNLVSTTRAETASRSRAGSSSQWFTDFEQFLKRGTMLFRHFARARMCLWRFREIQQRMLCRRRRLQRQRR